MSTSTSGYNCSELTSFPSHFSPKKKRTQRRKARSYYHWSTPLLPSPCHPSPRCTSQLPQRPQCPPPILLYAYYSNGRLFRVTSDMITSVLFATALSLPGYAGVQPDNIATRSLRSRGAMSLLFGGIDPDRIRILGRWRSDAMYWYLHSHALPFIHNNSRLIFSDGHYDLVTRTRTLLDQSHRNRP